MIYNKDFWKDTAERTIYTMAEVAIPLVPVSGTIENMNLGHILLVVVGSGIVCILKCIVAKFGSTQGGNE